MGTPQYNITVNPFTTTLRLDSKEAEDVGATLVNAAEM